MPISLNHFKSLIVAQYMVKSIVDDISLADEDFEGNAILFQNSEIRKMFRLAQLKKDDVFFDLGCGYGQNLKIALTEFNVSKAIGFEKNLERNKIANERLTKLSKLGVKNSRWEVRKEDFEKVLLKDKIKDLQLTDATVIFYGLSTTRSLLEKIEKRLKKGCRLICYNLCLFPEIMPKRSDFPFFVYQYPFKRTKSEWNWLNAIVQKEKSVFPNKKKPSVQELWDELSHDYDVDGDPSDVSDYKIRLRKLLKK